MLRKLAVFFLAMGAVQAAVQSTKSQQACTVETIAGDYQGPPPGNGGPALEAELVRPLDVRRGPDGAIYIADSTHRVIRRVRPDGVIEAFAGTGARGPAGDGGPAAQGALMGPSRIAFGPDGSLYFKDSFYIRKIDPSGVLSTVAGNGEFGPPEIGANALETPVSWLGRFVIDASGAIYAASSSAHRVFRIGTDGVVGLVAGRGRGSDGRPGFDGDGGPAVDALLDTPTDLVVDSAGRVYILDADNRRIRRVELDGTIDTYVGGTNTFGTSPVGTPREEILFPSSTEIEIDAEDRLYWRENEQIRRLPLGGALETAALLPDGQRFYNLTIVGDGSALLIYRTQVYRVGLDGAQELVAGTGLTGPRGDGGPARTALMSSVAGLAAGPNGEIYYADNGYFRVRRITADGRMERVAGTGDTGGGLVEGMPAVDTAIRPSALALDPEGRVLFSEDFQGRILRIESDGTLSWIAGDGRFPTGCRPFECGEGGPAREASIARPDRLAVDSDGVIYVRQRIRDQPSLWVRRIGTDGIVRFLDRRTAEGAPHDSVASIAMGPQNRLFVATSSGFAGSLFTFNAEGEQARVPGYEGFFRQARAMAIHPNGEVYIVENFGHRISKLDNEGRRQTVAGSLIRGRAGGDGPVAELELSNVSALAFTQDGDLLIADDGNDRLLRIHDVAACPEDNRPQVAVLGWRNGASFSTLLSPGAIFSVFGRDLGPQELALAQVSGGSFPTEIAGTRVLFDGIPAPLIFAQNGQVSGIVPWGAPATVVDPVTNLTVSGPARLAVEVDRVRSEEEIWGLQAASPAFFTLDSSGTGLAAALNQDGSVNGALNPAAPGSVLVLFGTGFGPLEPAGTDGVLTGTPLPQLVTPPMVRINGQEVEVLYAGPAPGLVSGVTQINVRVPEGLGGAVVVEALVGERRSQQVQVIVGQ